VKINGKRIDPPSFHRPYGKDGAAGDDSIRRLRNATENTKDKSADRRCVFVGDVNAKPVVQLADVRASRDERFSRTRLDRLLFVFGRVVFVKNLADDLLEQVFHGDDSGSSAVLVENDSHVLLQPLVVSQYVLHFAGARNYMNRTYQLAKREPRR